jgi:hypothetical protein
MVMYLDAIASAVKEAQVRISQIKAELAILDAIQASPPSPFMANRWNRFGD